MNVQKLKSVDTTKVAYTLTNKSNIEDDREHLKSIIRAYIIYKMQTTTVYPTMEAFLNNADLTAIQKEIITLNGQDCFEIALNNLNSFSTDELLSYMLFHNLYPNHSTTPRDILDLAFAILNIQPEDHILELCSGKGNFGVEAYAKGYTYSYTGIELNCTHYDIARFRASILQSKDTYILSDALTYRSHDKADKIFSNYPFMVKNMHKDMDKRVSSDWYFNLAIMDQLKEGGKAVAIMTTGSTWNRGDEKMRQTFIEKGYIESVIALPPHVFEEINIPVTMIVLSHHNQCVRLVDAKDLFKSERKKNYLTQEHIDAILEMLSKDGATSITKTIEELAQNEYILNARRYLDVLPTIENGVEFGSLIKKITRGSQLKATDLDVYKSETPTPYQYLILSNINDGIMTLDNEGQYLNSIPEKLEKYCIPHNALVLSKTGMPAFKSAIANIPLDTKVVASGNLFVIELDETKVNPYYIQAFLQSHLGEAILKSIYTGAAIPTMTIEKLNKMIVPLPDLEKQNEIAAKYTSAIDTLASLNHQITKLKADIKDILTL